MGSEQWHIHPGHGLGFMTLGGALQDILVTIDGDKTRFTDINVQFSQSDPLTAPIVVSLPPQGLRLRFDGADQRLRLIEVTDLKKIPLVSKSMELVKPQESSASTAAPHFKRIYQMFGASYPGEYMHPPPGSSTGTYILSWPGIAFNFPLQHSAYSPDKDHVSLLSSHAAGPASQMALFEGRTWADARGDLFIREPSGPRSTSLANRTSDNLPAEIEAATLFPSANTLTLERRHPAPPFSIFLNQTTPQDLMTELGPPSTTHNPIPPSSPSPNPAQRNSVNSAHARHAPSQPSSYSSSNTDTFETDFETPTTSCEDPLERAARETYWCYFHHGLDVLVGPPAPTPQHPELAARDGLVVRRVVLQGNVPGSAAFNRHRRLRWTLCLPSSSPGSEELTSESDFPTSLKPALLAAYPAAAADPQTSLGRVINRCWDDALESSFYLPDQDRDADGRSQGSGEGEGEAWLGNVRLFQFVGVMFEVLGCGSVAGVYFGT